MKIGTQEAHEALVRECEEIFPLYRDLQMNHVHFERHSHA
jgi:hypothetical protein